MKIFVMAMAIASSACFVSGEAYAQPTGSLTSTYWSVEAVDYEQDYNPGELLWISALATGSVPAQYGSSVGFYLEAEHFDGSDVSVGGSVDYVEVPEDASRNLEENHHFRVPSFFPDDEYLGWMEVYFIDWNFQAHQVDFDFVDFSIIP